MPIKSQVSNPNGTNAFLYDYLEGNQWYSSEIQPLNHVTGVCGYWTLTPSTTITNAWSVAYNGMINDPYVNDLVNRGLRPVIKISKSKLSQ